MPFLPGLELCRRFYEEAVHPLLTQYFPALPYAHELRNEVVEELTADLVDNSRAE